ncbi:MAG: hypothetical protein U5N56_02200 [Candidatus Marinimicrobia bacterium]|nr:hypothetical protein [Candidatus Neomarinimicrobiota bacterium]
MQDHFKDIRFYRADENSWLIWFTKDGEEKFISDKDGWMIYEGTVFALRENHMHTVKSLWELYKSSRSINDLANSLDGHFVIKIYDAQQNRYYILNDFIKNKTHYYCETQAYLCYTSYSYLSAIITDPEPDLYAINEFMWRYYVLSERSFLKNTKRMSAASIHGITNAKTEKTSYWQWPRHFSADSFQQQVGVMTENMKETARLLGGNFYPDLDFTQGQDSRQVIAAMLNQEQAFHTSTFGKSDFEEVKATEEMAERYRIPHHSITLGKDFTSNPLRYFEKAIIYGSGEEPGYQLGRILYMREKQLQHGDAVCNGMDGHFYKNGLWDEMYTFNFYREPRAFNIDMFLDLRMLSQDYDDSIFSPALRSVKEGSRGYFHEIINSAVSGMEQAPVSMQVDKFDLLHWLNFAVASNNASNSIGISLSPLLFRRNLEDALKVPVKWKFNLSAYQRAVVFDLHSELAAEKTDFAGINMLPKNAITYPFFLLRYGWHQSKRLRNKFLSKLGFHPKTHLQEAWDYLPVYKTLYRQMKERGFLAFKNMSLQEILIRDQWDGLIERSNKSGLDKLADHEYIFKVISIDRYFNLASEINSNFQTILKKNNNFVTARRVHEKGNDHIIKYPCDLHDHYNFGNG